MAVSELLVQYILIVWGKVAVGVFNCEKFDDHCYDITSPWQARILSVCRNNA